MGFQVGSGVVLAFLQAFKDLPHLHDFVIWVHLIIHLFAALI